MNHKYGKEKVDEDFRKYKAESQKSRNSFERHIQYRKQHDQYVNPKILVEHMGKFAFDNGQTILHSAVAHALKTKKLTFVKNLLDLGCPMYHANKRGQSILYPIF